MVKVEKIRENVYLEIINRKLVDIFTYFLMCVGVFDQKWSSHIVSLFILFNLFCRVFLCCFCLHVLIYINSIQAARNSRAFVLFIHITYSGRNFMRVKHIR